MRLFSLLAILALALTGCAIGVRPQPGGGTDLPTVTAELSRLGQYAVWCGGFLLALGVVGRLGAFASLAARFISPIAGLLGLGDAAAAVGSIAGAITETGAAMLSLGLVSIWLAGHPWLMALALVAAALAFAWRNFDGIRAWVLVGKKPGRKPIAAVKE